MESDNLVLLAGTMKDMYMQGGRVRASGTLTYTCYESYVHAWRESKS